MKLRKVLLTGLILSGSLLANTLSDTTALIGQISNASKAERHELMNQIKSNIHSLNKSERSEAFRAMDQARKERRANYKASLSPEKLAEYEEKAKLRQEAKARYRANKSANLDKQKDGAKKRKGGYKRTPMTQEKLDKIKASLSPEQLVRFASKLERQQNRINSSK